LYFYITKRFFKSFSEKIIFLIIYLKVNAKKEIKQKQILSNYWEIQQGRNFLLSKL